MSMHPLRETTRLARWRRASQAFALLAWVSMSACDAAPEPAPDVFDMAAGPEASDMTPDTASDVQDMPPEQCVPMFGRPVAATGLGADVCAPTCGCAGSRVEATQWTPERLAALSSWTELDPPEVPEADPYALDPSPVPMPDAVCAVEIVDAGARTYRVRTFATQAAALEARARITHTGACGLCSSLENLKIYASTPDLTEPVRACGLTATFQGQEEGLECILELGFEPACAAIWLYNAQHTRAECAAVCIRALGDPYHTEDGALNACLQCDEDISGPVFKAVAGRTRRNSGLASALCRPCDDASVIAHDYEP